MKDVACRTCRYFKEYAHENECRRHAPRVFWTNGGDESGWPKVHGWDWCGEYQENRLLAGWPIHDISLPMPTEIESKPKERDPVPLACAACNGTGIKGGVVRGGVRTEVICSVCLGSGVQPD